MMLHRRVPALLAAALVSVGLLATPAAATTPSQQPGYFVALGDSYASGQGITNPADLSQPHGPYDEGTARPIVNNCRRHRKAWQRTLTLPGGQHIHPNGHASCSGAVIADITATKGRWSGAPDHLGQLRKLTELHGVLKDADAAFLTIGGNDAGFVDVLVACIGEQAIPSLDLCQRAATTFRRNISANRMSQPLQSTYQAILNGTNGARLHVTGYPELLHHTYDEARRNCTWLTKKAYDTFRALGPELNQRIRTDVETLRNRTGANLTYIDLTDAFAGHAMCSPTPWIRGINAVTILNGTAAHPTAEGNAAISTVVHRAITATETHRNTRTHLTPGDTLFPGERLTSPNGRYTLTMHRSGNLILRDGTTQTWASDTTAPRNAASLHNHPNGTIALTHSGTGKTLWTPGTYPAGSVVELTNQGSLAFSR